MGVRLGAGYQAVGELVCITEVAVEALAQGLDNVWGVGCGERRRRRCQ